MLHDKFDISENLTISNKNQSMIVNDNNIINPIGLVEIYNKKTGKLIYKDHNRIMLPASEFMSMRMFDFNNSLYKTPTYNAYLQLDNSKENTENDLSLKYKAYLFCMGTSGCAIGSQLKREVSNKSWIDPKDLVPFKYLNINEDLNDLNRRVYYGRKTDKNTNTIAYYFKRFDSNPILTREFTDGTPWNEEIYNDISTLKANVKVSLTMTVSESDGREYFEKTVGITDARFNTIQILAGWPDIGPDGYVYYQDVRPLTRLNFPNRALSELNDSFEIKYSFYF